MQFRVKQIPIFLALIALSGLVVGWRTESLLTRPPIVLIGSGNVFPFLEATSSRALSKLDPLWLDVGSSGAMQQAFYGFDYGRSIASKTRVGFIAMSSNGTGSLQDLFASADPQFRGQNYWLSMSIAKPPLTVLYRGDINKVLRITAEKRLPPDGDRSTDHSLYGSVLFADLKNLIESSPKLDHYYFPEEGAGTRARFDAENGSTPLKWPKMERSRDHLTEQVPDYIEELDGDFSFIELVSYPQLSRNTKEPASCDQLKKMGIRAAVVCANSNTCDHFIPADYELVIKVLPSSGEGSNGFVITNRAECMIAEALSPKVNKCQFSGTLHNNIVAIDATKNAASNFPEYLSCVP